VLWAVIASRRVVCRVLACAISTVLAVRPRRDLCDTFSLLMSIKLVIIIGFGVG